MEDLLTGSRYSEAGHAVQPCRAPRRHETPQAKLSCFVGHERQSWSGSLSNSLVLVSADPQPTPIWSLVANVVGSRRYGPGGAETRRGVKIFTGGAKVYLAGRFHCADALPVVGLSRHPHRLVNAVVHARFLTDWRVRLVYSPAVLRALTTADVGLDLPYRYRRERELDELAPVDQAGEDYRAWLADWAAILTDIGQRQAAEAEERFDRHGLAESGLPSPPSWDGP